MQKSLQRGVACLSQAGRQAPVARHSSALAFRSHTILQAVSVSRPAHRAFHRPSRLSQQAAAYASRTEPSQEDSGDGARITRFDELESQNLVHPAIVRTLVDQMRLETMTEVQSATINEALKGTDMIAQARTGTGKTIAFLLPILQRIINIDPQLARRNHSPRGPRTTADDIRALIISPTRELAEQIAEEAKKLTRQTSIIVQTAVGGTQKSAGLRAIQNQGCHLLVGTPGRLKDILTDPYSRVQTPDLSALVFDEADRLLDAGFWPDIQEIMRLLPSPVEKDRQTLMFSATVPHEVVDLVRSTLKRDFRFVKCVRDDEEPTVQRVQQRLVTVNGLENKFAALVELCSNAIEASKQPGARPFKAIVYYNSTAEVTLAASALRNLQAPSSADQPSADTFGRRSVPHPWHPIRIFDIHSRLTQGQRTFASTSFRNCDAGILLSSDVTARGLDFPNVTHVIQMALPPNQEQYVHRIGRTARAGKEGEGWLIVSRDEARETQMRLRGLPLKRDDSLATAAVDMGRASSEPGPAAAPIRMARSAMQSVPAPEKSAAYRALLGVYSWFPNKSALVTAMNRLAQFGWALDDPPMVSPGLASKLGIAYVPGIRIGQDPMEMGGGRSNTFGSRFGGSFGGAGGREGGRGGFGARRDDGFADRGSGAGFGPRRDDGFAGRGSGGSFRGGRDRSDSFGERRGSSYGSGYADRGGRGAGGDNPFGRPPRRY